MTLLPCLVWYDTETEARHTASLATDPNNPDQPLHKSLLRVPQMKLKVKILNKEVDEELKGSGLPGLLPTRGNPTDAGLDLRAAEDLIIKGLDKGTSFEDAYEEAHRATISTGIAVEISPGLGLFIQDRSSVSAKHGVHRVAGVVDSSYRGEVKVALVNLSYQDFEIKKGDRIAQAVISPVILAEPLEVDELSDTARGEGGFGSTGR